MFFLLTKSNDVGIRAKTYHRELYELFHWVSLTFGRWAADRVWRMELDRPHFILPNRPYFSEKCNRPPHQTYLASWYNCVIRASRAASCLISNEGMRLLPKDAKKIDVLWSNPCPSEVVFSRLLRRVFLLISMTHYNAMRLEGLSESRAGKVDVGIIQHQMLTRRVRFVFVELLLVGTVSTKVRIWFDDMTYLDGALLKPLFKDYGMV